MILEPIGFFHSTKTKAYEAARQPAAAFQQSQHQDYIELVGGKNFEQALIGLDTFSHIWVLFQFDRNQHWKTMVLPPRGTTSKKGVFATRAPYRPNQIGLSALPLLRIEGRRLYVGDNDLLDASPIFDIKPYLAYTDSIPTATDGWIQPDSFEVKMSEIAKSQLQFLSTAGLSELRPFLLQQLGNDPLNKKKKRIYPSRDDIWTIHYQTWDIEYRVTEDVVEILQILSGYTLDQLQSSEDKFGDLSLHRKYLENYPDARC